MMGQEWGIQNFTNFHLRFLLLLKDLNIEPIEPSLDARQSKRPHKPKVDEVFVYY